MEQRLKTLEETVSKLNYDLKFLYEVNELISKTPHLYNIQSVMKQYSSTVKSLNAALGTNKMFLKGLKETIPKLESRKQNQIQATIKRRDRNIQLMASKIPVLESAAASLHREDESTPGSIISAVKEEINASLKNMEKNFLCRKGESLGKINKCKERFKQKSKIWCDQAVNVKRLIVTFQKEKQNQLTEIDPPDRYDPKSRDGRDSIAILLVERAEPTLQAGISQFKSTCSSKILDFSVVAYNELIALRSEIQMHKESSIPTAIRNSNKADLQLSSALEIIKGRVYSINNFSSPTIEDLAEIALTYKAIIEDIRNGTQDPEEFYGYKKFSTETKDKCKAVEKNMAEMLTIIDDIFQKATGISKNVKNKKLLNRFKATDKEVGGLRAKVKEFLGVAKVKIESFNTTVNKYSNITSSSPVPPKLYDQDLEESKSDLIT